MTKIIGFPQSILLYLNSANPWLQVNADVFPGPTASHTDFQDLEATKEHDKYDQTNSETWVANS